MRQNLIGQVIGTAMQKTAKVRVARTKLVKKLDVSILRHKNYLAHDEQEVAIVGDMVRIEACRPLSPKKTFTVAEIIRKAKRYMDPLTGLVYSEFQPTPIGYDRYAMQGIKMGRQIIGGEDGYYRFAMPWEKTDHGVFAGIDEEKLAQHRAKKAELAKQAEAEEEQKRQIIVDAKWEKQKEWLDSRPTGD